MYLFVGCILIAAGIFMLFVPKVFYELTERWKSASEAEPSKGYLLSIRFGGTIFVVIGILALFVR